MKEATATKKGSIAGRVIGISVFAIAWFCLSLVITVLFAEAEDPAVPSTAVPWFLSGLYFIARFPMCDLLLWDLLRLDIGETKATDTELLGIFANGIFWGIIFCFLCPKFLRFIRMKYGAKRTIGGK